MKKPTSSPKAEPVKKTASKTRKIARKTSKEEIKPELGDTVMMVEQPKTGAADVPLVTLSNPVKLGFVVMLLLIAAVGYLYSRFWIVATVNGTSINRLEYYRTMEKQVGKQTLDSLVTDVLIKTEAEKKGVTIAQTDIDAQLAEIETQLKDQGQTLDEALAQQGMTKADLVDQIRLQKMVEILGAGTVTITDEQINKFLTDNKDQLPANQTQEQLKEFAKTQLSSQTKNKNIRDWLTNLRSSADVQYR